MADPAFDDWDDEEDAVPSGAPQVGIVVVAVTNFLVGTLAMVGGVILATSGMGALDTVLSQANAQGLNVEQVRGIVAAMLGVIAMLLVLFGVAAIVAGVGVLKRLAWARGLAMVLGSFAGILAIISLVTINPFGVVPFGAHSLVMLLVLNDKTYSYQFR